MVVEVMQQQLVPMVLQAVQVSWLLVINTVNTQCPVVSFHGAFLILTIWAEFRGHP
jgi:hypothetical protein